MTASANLSRLTSTYSRYQSSIQPADKSADPLVRGTVEKTLNACVLSIPLP